VWTTDTIAFAQNLQATTIDLLSSFKHLQVVNLAHNAIQGVISPQRSFHLVASDKLAL
jgi:hypothetical protein